MRETLGEKIGRIAVGIAIIIASLYIGMEMAKADTITLEEPTTVVFRGTVTSSTVATAQTELIQKCSTSKTLYLVLDTPGGEVEAGNQLIDTLPGLKCKVHTVTLFAASMGFQIVQNGGTRYISPNGVLMSHRARGGLSGEMPGSFDVRSRFWLDILVDMDRRAAERMGMSIQAYRTLIRDEYWVRGDAAVSDKAADKVVSIRCGQSLNGTTVQSISTLFGDVKVTWSACPMVTAPLSVELSNVQEKYRSDVRQYVNLLFNNKTAFVSKYVLTGEYRRFQ